MRYRQCNMLRVTPLLFLALTLTACVGSPGKLSVDLAPSLEACRRLERDPSFPQIVDSDYRILSAEALAEIRKAKDGKAARDACERRVIAKFKAA